MCGMAIAASLALADLYGAGGGHAIQPPVVNPLAAEPLYADIVGRASAANVSVSTQDAKSRTLNSLQSLRLCVQFFFLPSCIPYLFFFLKI